MKSQLLFICYLCSTLFVFSQVKDTTKIKEVLIYGQSPLKVYQKTSIPFHFVNEQEISRTDPTIITPVLNRVPGVLMQQGALNTNRITIRGIGARSQFSTNRLKAYLNNIPLTSANGESIIDDIDLSVLGGVNIIKGPNSTAFGADIGGVLQLKAKEISTHKNFANYANLSGSYGLQKNSFQAGHKNNYKQLLVSYFNLQKDGFRENSQYKRESLNLLGKIYSNEKTTFSFIGVLTNLKAFIPSSLTQEDLENNPSFAALNWRDSEGFESYTRGLFGITMDQRIAKKFTNKTSIFTNFKDAYEPRPFDILDENTIGIGLRSNFQLEFSLFKNATKLNFGLEVMQEWHATSNYDNLFREFTNQGSVQGDLFFSVDQTRNYQNYFAELSYQFHEKLIFETGININSTAFEIEDRFLNSGFDQSSKHRYSTAYNPRVGLNFEAKENKHLYVSVSRGFSVPTVSESLGPNGVLNTNLKPETAWNYELGAKLNFLNNKLISQLSLFSLQVDNLLVARRTAEDQFVGINAGKTSHRGIESLVKGNLNYREFLIQPYFSGTFNFFEFDEFVDGENNYSGNDLTGVPDMVVNLGLDFAWRNLQVFTNWNYVGKIPLNDANALYSDDYRLLNAKIVYQFNEFNHFKVSLNTGVNNILDEKYAASILPNAVGFGNSPARFYYPGLPRNYFVGANVSYTLE